MPDPTDLTPAELRLLAAAARDTAGLRASGVPPGLRRPVGEALQRFLDSPVGVDTDLVSRILDGVSGPFWTARESLPPDTTFAAEVEAFQERAAIQEDGEAPGTTGEAAGQTPHHLTDSGNAERFADRHGDRLRYVHGWDRWRVWDGSRWAADDRREVGRLALESARSILAEAATAATKNEADALARHAIRSEGRHAIENALALARSLPPLALVPDDMDRDAHLLNLPNGTLDTRTGALLPHDSVRLITKLAPVAWDPAAKALLWDAFLRRIFPDPALRAFVQRAAGYSLTGDIVEHCLFFCFGTGRNGKTTLMEVLRELLGEGEYAKAAAPDLLLARRYDRHQAEVADLRGARFVTTVEVGEGRSWDEARVKWLTGGDAISARFLYGNPFTFAPTHKFWIAGNHRPRVRGADLGFWRRVHLIPFEVTIPKAEQDPDLRAKLRKELPGILRWTVEGCLAWRKGGLMPPAAVETAVEDYRAHEDVVAAFLEEKCVAAPGKHVLCRCGSATGRESS